MMRVRCIFVETTFPVRIRPRIETSPVNGHFLSIGKSLKPNSHRIQLLLPTNVASLDRGLGCPEAQTNVFVPSSTSLAGSLCRLQLSVFVVEEDVRLLLVSALRLHCQFGRHDCGCVAIRNVDFLRFTV